MLSFEKCKGISLRTYLNKESRSDVSQNSLNILYLC